MKVFISRFTHIAEDILEQLDNKRLISCREVSKSWQEFIDQKKFSWIRLVNMPTLLNNGNKYLHFAAKAGQIKLFNDVFESEEVKDPKNDNGVTPFHIVCSYDHLKLVDILISKSATKIIDIGVKDEQNWTAVHYAFSNGHLKTAELLLKKILKVSNVPTKDNLLKKFLGFSY